MNDPRENLSSASGVAGMKIQFDLFDSKPIARRFDDWKSSRGGAQIMRMAYREAAWFAARYQRTGQRVSMDYLYHRLRDRLNQIRTWLTRRGIELPRESGYRLNDHFTAYIARHIMTHRPEWDGLFETRTVGKEKAVERTIVVREKITK